MTYRDFKEQLYHCLLELETTKRAEIGILEKGICYEDETALNVIRAVNLSEKGREDRMLKVDLLYAVWRDQDYDCMLYWPVRQYFERFKTEGWQSILPELAVAISRKDPKNGIDRESDNSFVEHRANLILRPLHLPLYEEELGVSLYWNFGEIALVLYLLVFDDPENFISMKLERNMTDKWHRRDEVLLTGALLNCCSRMPARLYKAQDALDYYDERGGVFMPGEKGIPIHIDPADQRQGEIGYRLTTSRRVNGAVAIFYPGVKERLAELFEDDFYVGFTSVHEVCIHPVKHKRLSDVRAAVYHDHAVIEKRNILTDKLYRYVALRGELMEV